MLRAFRAQDEWLTNDERSRRVGLPEASGYRLIQTLEEIGAVIRDGRGRYGPGMLLLSLSRNVAHDRLLRDASNAILERLAEELGLIVHMGVLEDGMVTYVAKCSAGASFRVHTEVGAQLEAYCSALGKVLLAALRQYQLQVFLEGGDLIALTPNTITQPWAFRSELDKIRKQGWAMDDGEIRRDMRCLAVPVKDAAGMIVAAISSSGEASFITEARQGPILEALWRSAAAIEKNICRSGDQSPFRLPDAARRSDGTSAPFVQAAATSHY